MIVILARPLDRGAWALAQHWSRHDARLLTCNDLSRAGWSHATDGADAGTAVVGGQALPAGTIAGVLTRLPAVYPEDLVHVVAEDRGYVAAEMTAFLQCWLTDLPARVVNRPAPNCLAGPGWAPEGWARAAAAQGMAVRPVRRRASRSPEPGEPSPQPGPDATAASVTVVGDRCFGEGIEALEEPARRLAEAAGVEFLTVRFDGREPGARFLDANPCPEIVTAEVARAVAALLSGGTPS